MTALDLPRLVFSGDFQADVSTVNNDVRHYDVATFERRFQQPRTGPTADGWWNVLPALLWGTVRLAQGRLRRGTRPRQG